MAIPAVHFAPNELRSILLSIHQNVIPKHDSIPYIWWSLLGLRRIEKDGGDLFGNRRALGCRWFRDFDFAKANRFTEDQGEAPPNNSR
jgi:hypothetical protein